MIHGPTRFVPDIRVDVMEKRSNICLDKNEGVYVRNIRTGEVKLVSG